MEAPWGMRWVFCACLMASLVKYAPSFCGWGRPATSVTARHNISTTFMAVTETEQTVEDLVYLRFPQVYIIFLRFSSILDSSSASRIAFVRSVYIGLNKFNVDLSLDLGSSVLKKPIYLYLFVSCRCWVDLKLTLTLLNRFCSSFHKPLTILSQNMCKRSYFKKRTLLFQNY